MSKLAIYDMLIADYGDKFTEARYAVENVDADWNDNALQIALSYGNDLNMEPDKIYEQLISEYGERFTPERSAIRDRQSAVKRKKYNSNKTDKHGFVGLVYWSFHVREMLYSKEDHAAA